MQTSHPWTNTSSLDPVRNTHTAEQPPHTLPAARPPPHFSTHPSCLLAAGLPSLHTPSHHTPTPLHCAPIPPLLTWIPPPRCPSCPLSCHSSVSLPRSTSCPSLLRIHLRHFARHRAWPVTRNGSSVRTRLLTSLSTVRVKGSTAEAAESKPVHAPPCTCAPWSQEPQLTPPKSVENLSLTPLLIAPPHKSCAVGLCVRWDRAFPSSSGVRGLQSS